MLAINSKDKVKFSSAPKAEILAALQRDANMQDATNPTKTFWPEEMTVRLEIMLYFKVAYYVGFFAICCDMDYHGFNT